MTWNVGDQWFVSVGENHLKGTIEKVGRRWLTVRTGPRTTYQFDLSKHYLPVKGPYYGSTPMLRTAEQVRYEKATRSAQRAVASLLDFTRKCRDVERLEQIAKVAESLEEPSTTTSEG